MLPLIGCGKKTHKRLCIKAVFTLESQKGSNKDDKKHGGCVWAWEAMELCRTFSRWGMLGLDLKAVVS